MARFAVFLGCCLPCLTVALRAASFAIGFQPQTTALRGGSPATPFAGARTHRARSVVPRRFAPLQTLTGGSEFLQDMRNCDFFKRLGEEAPGGAMDLGLMDENDVDDAAELVYKSFDRLFARNRWSENNPLGVLCALKNSFQNKSDYRDVKEGIKFRCGFALQFPTLTKPINQGSMVAFCVREKNALGTVGPLVGYFELCLMVPDGRRPEDPKKPSRDDPLERPYISNICVRESDRRTGLGRAMLRLAEQIVYRVWAEDALYLHIDDYLPSQRLYPAEGYINVADPFEDGVTHMIKNLTEYFPSREELKAVRQGSEEFGAEEDEEAEVEDEEVSDMSGVEVEIQDDDEDGEESSSDVAADGRALLDSESNDKS